MRHSFLPALLFLIPLVAFSQKHECAIFNFERPQELSPQVTPYEGVGTTYEITPLVFNDKNINLSFKTGTLPGGAAIATLDGSYELRVYATTTMTYSAINNSSIDSIRLSHDSTPGDLYLAKDEPGYMDPNQGNEFWYNNSQDFVNQVSFFNNFAQAKIKRVSVYYTTASDILSPISTDINSGQTVSSFKEINLTFADEMHILNARGITIANADNSIQQEMTPSVEGKTVKLSLDNDSPIEKDGTYTINIPARSFGNNNGYQNKELTYTIIVSTPKNTLNYESADPEPGNVEKLTNVITLLYSSYIKVAEGKERLTIKCNNEDIAYGKVSIDETHKKAVLTFTDLPTEITDEGVYTIDVPEGTIKNNMGTIWNPTFTLSYTIGSGSGPEPPTPVDPIEDSETMKKAKSLLLQTGVGYPSKESDTYKALAALVESETTPTDNELQAAIDAMYNETDVEMPVAGKYYKIAGKNASDMKLYMAYNDGEFSLSNDSPNATAFEAVDGEAENKYLFRTPDGKYLYVGGITEDEELDTLSLTKMLMADIDAEKLYGCMSITGNIKNRVDEVFYVPATISYAEGDINIATDATMTKLYFVDNLSSAFVISETEKPSDEIAVDATYTITPDVLESTTEVLTLTFTEPSVVTLADGSLPYFTNASGEEIENAEIYALNDTENQFMIRPGIFSAGEYHIVMPEGTFTCVDNGVKRKIKEISKSFSISGDDEPVEGEALELTYTITPDEIVGTGVLTITFANIESVTLKDNTKPYFATKGGERIKASDISVDSNHANTFIVNVTAGYAAGDYQLILPEGTFTCVKDGVKHSVKTIAKEFKIAEKQIDYDFNYNYSTISFYEIPNDSSTPVMDTALNNVIIYVPSTWYTGLVPDKTKTVKLVLDKNNTLVTTGHFEPTEIPEDYTYAIRLVLDNPIKEGDLRTDNYTVQIQKGTFGDANFGKYINGDKEINPSECRANPLIYKTLYVNNEQATSISDLNISGTQAENVIYDLTGRRIQSMSHPGVYIVNGRKVVKR